MKKRTLIFWGIIIVGIAYMAFVFIFPENKRTILFGGTMEIKVEPGQKVMIATFKGNNLFYMLNLWTLDIYLKLKSSMKNPAVV